MTPRKEYSVMSDDAGKLRQPLVASTSEDDTEDEELGGLLPQEAMRTQIDEGVAARRKRRRRKEDEDLGEVAKVFSLRLEPLKVLRAVATWMLSLSAAGNLLSSPKNSLPTSLSTQMLTRHRNKEENMDDVSERALAVLAVITLGFCCLLLLVVYVQTV